MFNKKEVKSYQISKEEVAKFALLADYRNFVEKDYAYRMGGVFTDLNNLRNNIYAKLSLDESKSDIDWSSVFKDNKIYVSKKETPKEEVKEDNA